MLKALKALAYDILAGLAIITLVIATGAATLFALIVLAGSIVGLV